MTVYVCIGNSDNGLTQLMWAKFQDELLVMFEDQMRQDVMQIHGVWYSAANSEYQNMCICFDYDQTESGTATVLKEILRGLAKEYEQDSITWAEAETTFLAPS